MLSANISYFGSACAIIINESNFAEKTTHFVRAYTYFSLAHVSARIIIREES